MDEDLITRGTNLLYDASTSIDELRTWIRQLRYEARELHLFAEYMEALAQAAEDRLQEIAVGAKVSRG